MRSNFDVMIQNALSDAIEQTKDASNQDLEQQLTGLQSRVDIINASKTEADRIITADHSKIEQLSQVSDHIIDVVNSNSEIESQLIEQLKRPIKINGREVVAALEEEANTTMHQLITRKVAQSILDAQTQVADDRAAVAAAKQTVATSVSNLKSDIITAREHMFLMVSGLVVTAIVPGIILKIIMSIITIIGGFYYGKTRS
ncbi:hypothetical protein ACYATO_08805 [Lactobacillaceae bacterium Melli_B3]